MRAATTPPRSRVPQIAAREQARIVYRIQMGNVGRILRHRLDVAAHHERTTATVAPLTAVDLRYPLNGPRHSLLLRMVPHENAAVHLARCPLLQLGHRSGHSAGRIRNRSALAVARSKLPLVERTLDAVALHGAANAQIGAQMRTVRIEDVRFAAFRAKYDKVFACSDLGMWMML